MSRYYPHLLILILFITSCGGGGGGGGGSLDGHEKRTEQCVAEADGLATDAPGPPTPQAPVGGRAWRGSEGLVGPVLRAALRHVPCDGRGRQGRHARCKQCGSHASTACGSCSPLSTCRACRECEHTAPLQWDARPHGRGAHHPRGFRGPMPARWPMRASRGPCRPERRGRHSGPSSSTLRLAP